MATRTKSEEVDLYDILKNEFLKTTTLTPGDAVHGLLPKGVSYKDEEVGMALTRLLIEGYLGISYRRGSGMFGSGSSSIAFFCTDKLRGKST